MAIDLLLLNKTYYCFRNWQQHTIKSKFHFDTNPNRLIDTINCTRNEGASTN